MYLTPVPGRMVQDPERGDQLFLWRKFQRLNQRGAKRSDLVRLFCPARRTAPALA